MEYEKRKEWRGTIEMAVAMLVSGSIGLFVIKSGQAPENVVFFRCAIACVCVLPICLFHGRKCRENMTSRKLAWMVVSGLFVVFNWIFLFNAFSMMSISLATIVYHVNPFIILLAGAFVFREKIALSDGVWTVLAFIGLLTIVGFGDARLALQEFAGIGLVLLATSLYSGSVLIAKKLSGIPPLFIVFVQTLAGALATFPITSITTMHPDVQQWQFIVALGVVHTAFLYWLIYSAISKIGLGTVAILTFLYPVSTVVIDYLFFDHVISIGQSIGAMLILVSAVGVKLHWRMPWSPWR
ncbi:DMT family transporter [Verminephrobacter aporrectodeae subsp. tuberculatae]|nr:DMT family transporter [Verminephrobacter aporrectodeae subsp. tuberculatae]MCW5288816.1 DMT family transporter [Verminephrobacter aporrectodeae subsp. tuberculatae]